MSNSTPNLGDDDAWARSLLRSLGLADSVVLGGNGVARRSERVSELARSGGGGRNRVNTARLAHRVARYSRSHTLPYTLSRTAKKKKRTVFTV